jgi:hypothetical protein
MPAVQWTYGTWKDGCDASAMGDKDAGAIDVDMLK